MILIAIICYRLNQRNPLSRSTMNQQVWVSRLLQLSMSATMSVACLILLGNAAYASPCVRLRGGTDAWVTARVDALVRAARNAYVSDEALPKFQRVLDGIADTIRQCKLSEDNNFTSRYRTLVEYLEAASLDRQPDHELGFVVPD